MKHTAAFVVGVSLVVVTVRSFAVQSAPARLALELQDYAALPLTADDTNTNTRAQLARVNYIRDEPGGRRFFVNDLNGPLYILDKETKAFTTCLNFNGRGGRPGLFPKFTFEANFATGLTSFVFDPHYSRNGVLYTLHMEDPATDAPATPTAGVVVGLDLTGYTTTPAVTTPTVGGRIDREVVLRAVRTGYGSPATAGIGPRSPATGLGEFRYPRWRTNEQTSAVTEALIARARSSPLTAP